MGGTPSSGKPRVPEHFPRRFKQKYKVIDLPLPENSAYFEKWRKSFVPSLLAWAGANEDPFKVNNELYSAVPHIWKRVFPGLKLADIDLLTVVKVVSRME